MSARTPADRRTPKGLFNAINAEFNFTLDPCSTHANALCAKHFTIQEDGLVQSWKDETAFMNPPYGRDLTAWMKKAHGAAFFDSATVVCLVPVAIGAPWWRTYAQQGEIRLLCEHQSFGEVAPGSAFPSAIVVFRPGSNYMPPPQLKPLCGFTK